MRVVKILQSPKILSILFLFSFLLVKLPPFYFIPFLRNEFLTTHSLSALLVFGIFIVLIAEQLFKKGDLAVEKSILVFFLLYFFFQSLSILASSNLGSFFQSYKSIVFAGIFLFLTLQFKNTAHKIIPLLFFAIVFNFFYQIVMFLSPSLFTRIGEFFIYEKHFDLISINLERSRLFIETYDEITIPFLFIFLHKARTQRQRILIMLLFVMIALPAFLSNFRIRVLMLLFSSLVSFIFLMKKQVLSKALLLLLFFASAYLGYSILNATFGFSFVDRFALEPGTQDLLSVETRLTNIDISVDMGLSNPLLGVGLGNYYDNLPLKSAVGLSLFEWKTKVSQIAATHPHNIFAQIISETGVLSFFFYLLMTLYFLKTDFKLLRNRGGIYKKGFVISFWTLYIYSIFNPTTTLGYNAIFWVLRGIIHSQ